MAVGRKYANYDSDIVDLEIDLLWVTNFYRDLFLTVYLFQVAFVGSHDMTKELCDGGWNYCHLERRWDVVHSVK